MITKESIDWLRKWQRSMMASTYARLIESKRLDNVELRSEYKRH
jgi:hypothetical protein